MRVTDNPSTNSATAATEKNTTINQFAILQ